MFKIKQQLSQVIQEGWGRRLGESADGREKEQAEPPPPEGRGRGMPGWGKKEGREDRRRQREEHLGRDTSDNGRYSGSS